LTIIGAIRARDSMDKEDRVSMDKEVKDLTVKEDKALVVKEVKEVRDLMEVSMGNSNEHPINPNNNLNPYSSIKAAELNNLGPSFRMSNVKQEENKPKPREFTSY